MLKIISFIIILCFGEKISANERKMENDIFESSPRITRIIPNLPLTTMEEVIVGKCITKSIVNKDSLNSFFNSLCLSQTQESTTTQRYSICIENFHLIYINTSLLPLNLNINGYEYFLFDPDIVDGAGNGLLIPITGIKKFDRKTFYIRRARVPSGEEKPTLPLISAISSGSPKKNLSSTKKTPFGVFKKNNKVSPLT